MIMYDTIVADQIEYGDQVMVEGDPLGDVRTHPHDDPTKMVVRGYSYNSGDMVEYALNRDDTVELWSV